MRMLFGALWLGLVTIAQAETETEFNRDIRPILFSNCVSCHGPDEEKREADLRLDRRQDALEVLAPGKRDESELWRRVTTTDPDDIMPPKSSGHALTAEQIALLGQWIDEGAPYAQHWSFIAPIKTLVPETSAPAWAAQPWDRFIHKKLDTASLPPSADASRATLLRRASLDLRGLPPSLDEVATFESDQHPEAYARQVDRLLASPSYGERWARVWLDLARYADSRGYGSDPLRKIWRYRDWVIDAYNDNMPFDQFTIEQLAGDLLDEPATSQLLATAFHRNTLTNTLGGTIDEEFRVVAVKDRVDTTSQVWMGLTMRCAQCHNHKFDPISQQEYYQMFAIFNQTEDSDRPDEFPTAPTPTWDEAQKIDAMKAELQRLRAVLESPDEASLQRQRSWEATTRDQGSAWHEVRTGPGKSSVDLTGATAFRITLPAGSPEARIDEVSARFESQQQSAVNGRFVRLQLPGKAKIIHIAELQAYSGGENVAISGSASQSSTGFGGAAARGIDGNTEGQYTSNSTTHTAIENDPWWEVDLKKDYPLDQLVLWNRTDGDLQKRLNGVQVKVLDADREEVWQQTIANAPKRDLALDVSGPGALPVVAVSSSHGDENVGSLIDGDSKTSWSITEFHGQPAELVFSLGKVPDKAMAIDWQLSGRGLDAVKIHLTRVPELRTALPHELRGALAKAPEVRDADEAGNLASYFRSMDPELASARKQIAALEQRIKEFKPTVTPVMRELPKDKQRASHVMVKGNYLVPGEAVVADLPKAFPRLPEGERMNRKGLARWLVHRDNPLTARVTANRLWSQLFGRGLVETQEDFGTQGTFPSHPDLLDWLAVDLIDRGWDQKSLLRTMVTSKTYQQTSKVSPEHLEKDPDNRLLGRGPRFRLEAEMVRDQALAISGLLTQKLHGPSVYPPQPKGLWQAAFNGERSWDTSTGEDRYRRGLYVFLRRSVPYPSMATFDAPNREICIARRISTNTPLQAFVTLNDPAFVEMAQALARRMIHEGGEEIESQLAFGLRLCRLEVPTEAQLATLRELFDSEWQHYRSHAEEARELADDALNPLPDGTDFARMAALTVVANVLLNLDAVMMKY